MKAIKKMEITNVLSCFLVFVILMSVMPVFITQSDAVILVENYMGKVVGKDIKNNELTVQIEYKADYSTEQVSSWVPYHSTSQWTVSNSNAINEIRVGDYIEIAGFLGVDNEGESICIGKMKSSTEKVITDVYGDPGYLVPAHAFIEHPGVLNPPLLGNYIITYENIPDCSKYPSGSFACNVEAKYSDVTISKGNEQLKSQRLYPGRSFKYEDKGRGDNIDVTFNSGEAPAYPDCTDQPCLGPQAFSDFTIHTIESYKEVKFRGKVLVNRPIISFYSVDVKIDEILNDPTGKLRVGDVVTAWSYRDSPAKIEDPAVGDRVEVFGKYFGRDVRAGVERDYIDLETASHYLKIEKKPDLIIQDITWKPKNPKQGDNVEFTITVKNQGEGDAGEFHVIFAIDNFLYSSTFIVPSLAAGKTYTYTQDYEASECGKFTVWATADNWIEIEESDEDNNYKEKPLEIECEQLTRSLYVWAERVVENGETVDWKPYYLYNPEKGTLFSFAEAHGINTLYLSTSHLNDQKEHFASFSQEAHSRGIKVHALSGDKSWATNHEAALDFVDDILKYNKERSNEQRFDGIHFDIECDDTDINSYVNLLTNLKSHEYNGESISSHGMILGIDTRFGWESEVIHYTDVLLDTDVDFITVMAYRDTAGEIVNVAKDELRAASNYGKSCVIAVETGPTSEPEWVTFYEECSEALESSLTSVMNNNIVKNEPSFAGFAIHHYVPYKSMYMQARIAKCIMPSGTYKKGDNVEVEVTVENTGGLPHRFYVGFSVRDSNGKWWDAPYNDTYLNPRQSSTALVNWTVDTNALSGSYEALVEVWGFEQFNTIEKKFYLYDMKDEVLKEEAFEVGDFGEESVHNLDTGEDFATIQAVINDSDTSPGNTITVDPGTYNENVEVTKSLTIKSTSGNPEDTIVQAAVSNQNYQNVFTVTANNVHIDGFTIKGASYSWCSGILLNSNNCIISNNTFEGNAIGIWIHPPSLGNNIIRNNKFSSSSGYSPSTALYLEVANNKIYLNNFIIGIEGSDYPGNFWNSPSKTTYTYKGNTYTNYLGNYWSDYTDTDANGDGIWDHPYSIDEDKDNYPLVGRFENYVSVEEKPEIKFIGIFDHSLSMWNGNAQGYFFSIHAAPVRQVVTCGQACIVIPLNTPDKKLAAISLFLKTLKKGDMVSIYAELKSEGTFCDLGFTSDKYYVRRYSTDLEEEYTKFLSDIDSFYGSSLFCMGKLHISYRLGTNCRKSSYMPCYNVTINENG